MTHSTGTHGTRKRMVRHTLVATAGALLLLPFLGASPPAADTDSGATTKDAARALYQKKCAICHGKNGVARPMAKGAASLNDPEWQTTTSVKTITEQILAGKGKMPKQEGKLTPEQSEAIARYVLTLR